MADIFYPRRCAVCDRVLAVGEQSACPGCYTELAFTGEQYCLKCGRPVKEGEEFCGACRGRRTAYHSGRSVFLYNAALRESISRFKYHGRQEYAAFYAAEMYRACAGWLHGMEPDALLPVPIHRERYRKRGYNQAALLAGELGKQSHLPVVADYLVRIKNTIPQKELSERERHANLSQAFFIRNGARELYRNLNCVIIIDDIYTTGSTIEACAEVLQREGIAKICFLCISTGQGL